jgi:hypothetical protein
VTGAVSRKTQGGSDYDINILAGEVECRSAEVGGGPGATSSLLIRATFDRQVYLATGTPSDVTSDAGTVDSVSLVPPLDPPPPADESNVVEIQLSNVPLVGNVTLSFPGVKDAAALPCTPSPSVPCLSVAVGDYNSDGTTNFFDFSGVRNAGLPNQDASEDFRADFNASGFTDFIDFAQVNNAGLITQGIVSWCTEQVCNDGIDNDNDGDTDCADYDCRDDTACPEDCDNLTDDDADGAIDCNDSECDGTPACPEICDDTFDNDADGRIDCYDSDCFGAGCPESPDRCADGLDNDADGAIDCRDSDCFGAGCPEYPGNCYDGLDNDGVNGTDCADPLCLASDPNCHLTENAVPYPPTCDDGIDNNSDGKTDCADPGCVGDPYCQAEHSWNFGTSYCDDGLDNDVDGLTDCDDVIDCGSDLCACGTPSTNETLALCDNDIDDDCDGLIDCADTDCHASVPDLCGVTEDAVSCHDGLDNDEDGFFDCDDPDCFCDELCPRPWDKNSRGCPAPTPENPAGGDGYCDPVWEDPCNCTYDCSGLLETPETTCNDWIDNDCDGDIDCDDSDCAGVPPCP